MATNMIKRNVSPEFFYYFGLLFHLIILVATSLYLKEQILGSIQSQQDLQLGVVIFLGLFFSLALLFFLHYLNRHIYLKVLTNDIVQYGSLLRSGTIPARSVNEVRYLYNKVCRIRLGKESFYFLARKSDVKFVQDLMNSEYSQHT